MNFKYMLLVLSVAFGFAFAGCEKEGPAEKAGKNIDKVIEKTGEKVEEAGDKVKKATE